MAPGPTPDPLQPGRGLGGKGLDAVVGAPPCSRRQSVNRPPLQVTRGPWIHSHVVKHLKHGKAQTFRFGEGQLLLRLYDKCAEIAEKSAKTRNCDLRGTDHDMWRIE